MIRRRAVSGAVSVAALASGMIALAAAATRSGAFRDVTKSSGVDMRIAVDLPRLKLIATMTGTLMAMLPRMATSPAPGTSGA